MKFLDHDTMVHIIGVVTLIGLVVVLPVVTCLLIFRRVMRTYRRIGGRGCLGIIALIIVIVGGSHVATEYVWNAGPDDVGARVHIAEILTQRYGVEPQRVALPSILRLVSDISRKPVLYRGKFQADGANSRSGIYSFRYSYRGKKGLMTVRYDNVPKKFDRDEIIPDE